MLTTDTSHRNRLYQDLAWLWLIISPPEDYVLEALEFVHAVRKHARLPVATLLDLGCGGGHNDYTLKKAFQVTGVDLSEAMLELARRLNPEITYLRGDGRDIHLNQTFDAVIIADSIAYMLTEEDLLLVFMTAYHHLHPNGVFVTYAEETPDRLKQDGLYQSIHSTDDLVVNLVEYDYDPDPSDTTFEMIFVYLIRRSRELSIETDHHTAGIFPAETWQRLLKQVGFIVRMEWSKEASAPMFVGIKPVG